MNRYSIVTAAWTSSLLAMMYSSHSFAQSTPSEFAEMSLTDLFEQTIDDPSVSHPDRSPWSFTFQRKSAEFKDFLEGDNRVSEDEVLWSGPKSGEPRTDKNFPVVPGKIVQTAYLISLGYAFNDSWRGHLTVPYLEQNTDHISIVPNYSTFEIESSGVGDQQLPYTMQLGSGTYDFPIEISYHSKGNHDINLALAALIRSGTNDNDYRLGNSYSLAGRYNFHFSEILQPYIGLNVNYTDSIHGADTSLLVDSPYPYPAPITNPDLYGGTKIGARAGISWQVSDHYRLAVEIGKPIYQNLNGPQTREDWRSSLQISRPF